MVVGRHWAQAQFDEARRRAFWRQVVAFLTGRSNDLLPFEAVYSRFPIRGQRYLGLRTVPLEHIVGSVGRYHDFDRAFLPRGSRLRDRWVRVGALMWEQRPLPPVELYKVGEVYFVKDGHHRVSVARLLGQPEVEAYVTEVDVPVPLTPDVDTRTLDAKARQAAFLERTGLDRLAPDLSFDATIPGIYDRLEEHIATHRWYLGEARGDEVPYAEAVRSWLEQVYRPVVDIIRRYRLTEAFPDRTETDLYLWLSEYRWFLRQVHGGPEAVMSALREAQQHLAAQLPEASLPELPTQVPWLEALLLEMERESFLEHTGLGEVADDLQLTVPGKYRKLLEHIAVHRWYLGEERGEEVPYSEAARSWYDRVFRPLVELIEATGVMEAFPNRTMADLYVWLMELREDIHRSLGWDLSPEALVRLLVEGAQRGETMLEDKEAPLASRPADRKPGAWRRAREKVPSSAVFPDVLVALPPQPDTWTALEQAIWVVQRDGGRLHALHVRTPATRSPEAQERLWQAFVHRCRQRQVSGDLAFADGPVAAQVLRHATLVDLVVLRLAYPPGGGWLTGGGAGIRKLIHFTPRPLLLVPGEPRPLTRAMLAYDGSPKADEALFLAAWLAQTWQVALVVVAVNQPEALLHATLYLERRGVKAEYRRASGEVVSSLVGLWEAEHADWLIMGGYRRGPLAERLIGSTVNGVLNRARGPVLLVR